MQTTAYTAASDFLIRTQALLEREEAANNVILGIANMLINAPERFPEFYLVTVDDSSGVKLAGLMTPPHNLSLYAEAPERGAMFALARYFSAQQVTVPGVIGMVDTAHAFAAAWVNVAGGSWSAGFHERVYELRQVTQPVGVLGKLVLAKPEHSDTIADWLAAFYAEALPGEIHTAEECKVQADRSIVDKNQYLWVVEGEPVSMARGPGRQTRHGGTVGPVYTPPAKRGHGYASAVVAGVSQQILDSGKAFCALFTDLANPTSNSIYQKIGYRPLRDFDELKFEG